MQYVVLASGQAILYGLRPESGKQFVLPRIHFALMHVLHDRFYSH